MFHDPGSTWLEKAHAAAHTLQATTRKARGAKHSVYVVLLHDPRRAEPWGLYVGQTSRDPDLRFDQHKAGYKASGAARRFGVRLLPDLVAHLNPHAPVGVPRPGGRPGRRPCAPRASPGSKAGTERTTAPLAAQRQE